MPLLGGGKIRPFKAGGKWGTFTTNELQVCEEPDGRRPGSSPTQPGSKTQKVGEEGMVREKSLDKEPTIARVI